MCLGKQSTGSTGHAFVDDHRANVPDTIFMNTTRNALPAATPRKSAQVHTSLAAHIRVDIKAVTGEEDFGTADLLTHIPRVLGKQFWILGAPLGGNQAIRHGLNLNSICSTL